MKRLFILLSLGVALIILVAWKDPQINTQSPASIAAPSSCLDTAGQHLNWVGGAFTCGTTNSYVPLSGISATQAPGPLTIGVCNNFTITVTGATTAQTAYASAIGGVDVGQDVSITAGVTSANTVTVHECALGAITPASAQFRAIVE